MNPSHSLLAATEAAGVLVWLDQAKLRLRAAAEPPAALLDELRAHKAEIVRALLDRPDCTDCPDIASNGAAFGRQGIADSPDCPDDAAQPCVGFCRYGAWCCPDHAGFTLDAPPWDDDREWIFRWRRAGATLADREPVLRAWLAATPTGPLPRVLPAVELARIARQHGTVVEIEPRQPSRGDQP